MNREETIKFLALIKVAYPNAFRDMDQDSKLATINMWQMSFPDVPYPIMEQAFNRFRMVSKFPPTVAEMVEELRRIYYEADRSAMICRCLGDRNLEEQYRLVMTYTAGYQEEGNLGRLNMGSLYGRIGGEGDVQRLGASGDRMDDKDRLPLLDAGEWGAGGG